MLHRKSKCTGGDIAGPDVRRARGTIARAGGLHGLA